VETIGSKRSYALTWCMPNNDDDDDDLITLRDIKYCKMSHFETKCNDICSIAE